MAMRTRRKITSRRYKYMSGVTMRKSARRTRNKKSFQGKVAVAFPVVSYHAVPAQANFRC